MSLTQLATMIRDGTHHISVVSDPNDAKTPYILAKDKSNDSVTNLRFCAQQCNIIMAKPIYAKYPNLTFSRIASADDIALPTITDSAKLAKIAFHNNAALNDIITIRDYFRDNLPQLDGVTEYTKQLRKSDKYDDANSASVELPYRNDQFISFDAPYFMDENNEHIMQDAFDINTVVPKGSLLLAVVRVKFERYDDKLALKFYVTAARIHTRAAKASPAELQFVL